MRWQRLAIGVGFCPFWWQWGDVSLQVHGGRQFAVGPFRFGWRGWQ